MAGSIVMPARAAALDHVEGADGVPRRLGDLREQGRVRVEVLDHEMDEVRAHHGRRDPHGPYAHAAFSPCGATTTLKPARDSWEATRAVLS